MGSRMQGRPCLFKKLSLKGGDVRFPIIVDSSAARSSLAKGRSSARLLGPCLKRAAALQTAGGLYPAVLYGPTRLNTSDDPTRDCGLVASSDRETLVLLAGFRDLSRPRANWIRLTLLVGVKTGGAHLGQIIAALRDYPGSCRFQDKRLNRPAPRLGMDFDN